MAEENKRRTGEPVIFIYDDISAGLIGGPRLDSYIAAVNEFVQFAESSVAENAGIGSSNSSADPLADPQRIRRPIKAIPFSEVERELKNTPRRQKHHVLPVIRLFVAFSFKDQASIKINADAHRRIWNVFKEARKAFNTPEDTEASASPHHVMLSEVWSNEPLPFTIGIDGAFSDARINPKIWRIHTYYLKKSNSDGYLNSKLINEMVKWLFYANFRYSGDVHEAASTLRSIIAHGLNRQKKRKEGAEDPPPETAWSVFLTRGLYDPRLFNEIYYLLHPVNNQPNAP